MSVEIESPTITYQATGQTTLSVPFTFDDPTYVKVIFVDQSVVPAVQSELQYAVDYTTDPVGAPSPKVTLTTTRTNGQYIVYRETAIRRDEDFPPYDPLAIHKLNASLDRLYRIMQEKSSNGQSIVTPGTVTTVQGNNSDAVLPTVGAVYRHVKNAAGANEVGATGMWDSLASIMRGISTALGGIPISDGNLQPNLNAGKLQSYTPGNGANQLPVSNSTVNTNLNADKVDGYDAGNASGQVPVSNGTVNANLNADRLDGADRVRIFSDTGFGPNADLLASIVSYQSTNGSGSFSFTVNMNGMTNMPVDDWLTGYFICTGGTDGTVYCASANYDGLWMNKRVNSNWAGWRPIHGVLSYGSGSGCLWYTLQNGHKVIFGKIPPPVTAGMTYYFPSAFPSECNSLVFTQYTPGTAGTYIMRDLKVRLLSALGCQIWPIRYDNSAADNLGSGDSINFIAMGW